VDPAGRADDHSAGAAASRRRRVDRIVLRREPGLDGAGGVRRGADGAVSAHRGRVHNRGISVVTFRQARPQTSSSAASSAASAVSIADNCRRRQQRCTQTGKVDGEDRPVLGAIRTVEKCATGFSLLSTAARRPLAADRQGPLPTFAALSVRLSEGDQRCHLITLSVHPFLSRVPKWGQ